MSDRVWNRVVDVGNLYDFMSRNVEHAARRDVVNILTHERFKFNWNNPTGHYRLEMEKKVTITLAHHLRAAHSC